MNEKVNMKEGCERLSFLFARHGRALTGESPEHTRVVGNV